MFDAGCSDDFSPAQYLSQHYGLNSNINRLDKIIISHPDRDHIEDLPNIYELLYPKILSRNTHIPERVIYPSGAANLQEPLKAYKFMDEDYNQDLSNYNKNLPISNWGDVFVETYCCKPDHIPECLDSKLKNNLSLVSFVKYKDTEIVFPGDLEPLGWRALLDNSNITDYIGQAMCRILIAPHHGRKSGICHEYAGKKYLFTEFLEAMKPNLVIMSDKWGNESTSPDSYRPYVVNDGYPVLSKSTQELEPKQIITTKTNNFVRIWVGDDFRTPAIIVP